MYNLTSLEDLTALVEVSTFTGALEMLPDQNYESTAANENPGFVPN